MAFLVWLWLKHVMENLLYRITRKSQQSRHQEYTEENELPFPIMENEQLFIKYRVTPGRAVIQPKAVTSPL